MGEIHLYVTCWNEADMLGFFFRHYDAWVDRYVVLDDGSTDGTLDLLHAHPRVDVRHLDRSEPDSVQLSLLAAQQSVWHESRGVADWVVLVDVDEHLQVPGGDVRGYLEAQRRQGVTLVPALGFDLVGRTLPEGEHRLVDVVRSGAPMAAFNKCCVWDPDAVVSSGLHAGRHSAVPTGRLVLPERDQLMLWHYKHLDPVRWDRRDREIGARHGAVDRLLGLGAHYDITTEQRHAAFLAMESAAAELAGEGFEPDLVAEGPRWWEALGAPRAYLNQTSL